MNENTEDKIDYSSLQHHVNILEDLKIIEKNSSYSNLCKNLLETFGIKISIKEIQELYEPSIDELREDLEIQYKNVC